MHPQITMTRARTGPKPKPIAERFWPKVQMTDDCWVWIGSKNKSGYGQIGAGGNKGKPLFAHRVSWELHNGSIPKGMFICHTCDNPPCVRPDHLFLGTCADNHRDMAAKGRSTSGDRNPARIYRDRLAEGVRKAWREHPEAFARGERQGGAKLTEAAVRDIRERSAQGAKRKALAAEYGVSHAAIANIVYRRSWQHVK